MRIPFIKPHNDFYWRHRVFFRRYRRFHEHPLNVPIITFAALMLITGVILLLFRSHTQPVPNAYVVIVSHDHHVQTVPSREPTVGALLKKLHITLNEGDVVEPAATSPINQEDFRINVYRAVPVEVITNGTKKFAFSAATTPRSIAQQVGVRTFAEDEVTVQPVENFVQENSIGEQIVINPAMPININLYGALTITHTHAKTVAALIREKHIKLAKDDQVTPAVTSFITPNTQIVISRNGIKLETVTEPIAMPTQTIQDATLAFGTSAVRQQGSPGQKVTTYQDNLVNGKVVGRTVIQEVVTQAAVAQIVVVGTSLSGIKGDMALAGIAVGDYNYVDYIVSHESGWCPTKAQGQYGSCPAYAGYVPATGGYGLCQSTPGSKMATAGADWATNPVTQLRWCNGYAVAHYGSWAAAYNHWISYHWW